MSKSRSFIPGADSAVDDLPALRLSPEGVRALPLIAGPRLAVVGRIGPACGHCRDFERVVTRTGVAHCSNPVHAQEGKPPLPTRRQPHERDGRQPAPEEPGRPHSRLLQLVNGR